jgi:hypothetical protein
MTGGIMFGSLYMNVLNDRGIVKYKKSGREKHYYVEDEQKIMRLILTYRKSFWDTFVENVLETYFER